MEQIETQVTDLRYLAQAPVPLSDAASVSAYETPQPQPQPSPGRSASIGDNSAPAPTNAATPASATGGHSNKRKSLDDGGSAAKQTRSKRNRVSTRLMRFRAPLFRGY